MRKIFFMGLAALALCTCKNPGGSELDLSEPAGIYTGTKNGITYTLTINGNARASVAVGDVYTFTAKGSNTERTSTGKVAGITGSDPVTVYALQPSNQGAPSFSVNTIETRIVFINNTITYSDGFTEQGPGSFSSGSSGGGGGSGGGGSSGISGGGGSPNLVTSAVITGITAPLTGATPGSTASGTGNFTITAVSWSPSHNPFQVSTAYTVSVTLTANANYTFSGGLSTATINGNDATITSNTGTTATLSYQFPATVLNNLTISDPATWGLDYTNNHLVGGVLRSALTPIEATVNAVLYTERTATFTVKVSGFATEDDAEDVALVFTPVTGLGFSGHEATALSNTFSDGTKTFTVTVTLLDTTAFASGLQPITITGLTNEPASGYVPYSGDKTTSVAIIDGQLAARAIPVNQTNILAFNTYANASANSYAGIKRHYKLTEHIVLPSVGTNWTRIGSSPSRSFTGSFDGSGKTITKLTVRGDYYQGMFGYIGASGAVRNLGLIDVDIDDTSGDIGGIAGTNSGMIENCYVSGSVTSDYTEVGGIAGYNSGGTVLNCYSSAFVSGRGSVGGVVGYNHDGGIIVQCYAAGSVITGQEKVGGILGNPYATSDRVQNCIALNEGVYISSSTTDNIGRVHAVTVYGYGSPTYNNYAWEGMEVKYNWNGPSSGTDKTILPNVNGLEGADITAAQAKSKAQWETAGFEFTDSTPTAGPWTWNGPAVAGTHMPSLHGEQVDWPDYLQ